MKHDPDCAGGHWPTPYDCTGAHDQDCIGQHIARRCRTRHSSKCTGEHQNGRCLHADSCRCSLCELRRLGHTHSVRPSGRLWLVILAVVAVLLAVSL